MTYRASIPEYSCEEKENLPDSLLKEIVEI
jgi:hypothetical protein